MSLKQKTVSALIWSLIDNIANLGINFVIGIILARLLSPHEFGLIGMITIFLAVAQTFITGGFGQALIRKSNCTQADYSTVFLFNLVVSVFLFLVLFFSAGTISVFFNEPKLSLLIRVLATGLIINALSIIQKTILTKRLDFKLQTRISIIASIISGIIAIVLALYGFGVWSLVVRILISFVLNSFFLWYWNTWRPLFLFDKKSFNELFSFGGKILLSGLIDTIYQNIYYVVIGKYFHADQLGYYTRADQFQALPSQNMQGVIGRVSYPILATIQHDIPALKSAYIKLIKSTMLISFVLMIGMAAVAKSMIVALIGIKWLPSVAYLQLLCFVGMFIPLHALNLNMLEIQGRSDLFLRLEIIKKILAVPAIIIGIFIGIKGMIVGMFINTLIAYYLNSYWSGKFIGYSFFNQIKDILPAFLIAVFVSGLVFLLGILVNLSPIVVFSLQISLGILLTIGICEFIKFEDYFYIKQIIVEKIW
jgi:O-antigen/teichoic acid export membrane protein